MKLSTFAGFSLEPLEEVSLVVTVCSWLTLLNCQISDVTKLLLRPSAPHCSYWLTIVYRVERGKLKT